jgi:type II secretory pathway pseudopilin PulG
LLEVILALAILGVAMATLGQALGRSHQNARRAADQAELCFAAASLLDEMIVGARPLAAIDSEPVANPLDPSAPPIALVSLRIENGPLQGVLVLYASARPNDSAAGPLDAVELVRWMVDPALEESATAAASSAGVPL